MRSASARARRRVPTSSRRDIDRGLDEHPQRVKGRPRPRTLLVFGRERLSLRGIYASGGVGFLNDMLQIAGGANVFGDVKVQAVQASTEQVLARRPDVILETRALNSAWPSGDRAGRAERVERGRPRSPPCATTACSSSSTIASSSQGRAWSRATRGDARDGASTRMPFK